MFSLLDELRANDTGFIELCTGTTSSGRPFHAFIKMTVDNYLRYQADLKSGRPMNLGSYGDVIHTGWGREPDEDTKARILRDHTDMMKIVREMTSHASGMGEIIKRNSRRGEESNDR